MRVDFTGGTELIAPGTEPRLLLVVSGIAKTYLIAQNGRQATVRYARTGDILGSVSVYDPKPNLPGSRTLTPTAVLIFNMNAVRALATASTLVLIRDLPLECKGIGDPASGLDAQQEYFRRAYFFRGSSKSLVAVRALLEQLMGNTQFRDWLGADPSTEAEFLASKKAFDQRRRLFERIRKYLGIRPAPQCLQGTLPLSRFQ